MSFILINLLIHSLLFLSTVKSNGAENVFKVPLLHRTSPHLPASIRQPAAVMRAGRGDFFIEYWIGSSHKKEYGVIDTGSDVFWQQCQPCDPCYNQTFPVFNPNTSTTYTVLQSNSEDCHKLSHNDRIRYKDPRLCGYHVDYIDDGSSVGLLSRDDITIQTTRTNNKTFNMIIGCGHKNSDHFGEYASAVIGLNRNPLSLISQLNITRFSYCLPQYDKSAFPSTMNFGILGINSSTSSPSVVSTPLVHVAGSDSYHVTLMEIHIDDHRIPFVKPGESAATRGNTVIDIGTTNTYIYHSVFQQLVQILHQHFLPALPHHSENTVCFMTNSTTRFPTVGLKFAGGKVLELPTKNVFANDEHPNFHCLTIGSNRVEGYRENDVYLGAWTQANFMVGYRLGKKNKVYFKPRTCV